MPTSNKTQEQKVADKKVADKKVADKKVADQKIADQKAADQKTVDQKAADQKAADKKVADQKTVDKKVKTYKVKTKEKHLFHVEMSKGGFNPQTGKKVSKPFIQMFTESEWNQFEKSGSGLGYTTKVVWDPTAKKS